MHLFKLQRLLGVLSSGHFVLCFGYLDTCHVREIHCVSSGGQDSESLSLGIRLCSSGEQITCLTIHMFLLPWKCSNNIKIHVIDFVAHKNSNFQDN